MIARTIYEQATQGPEIEAARQAVLDANPGVEPPRLIYSNGQYILHPLIAAKASVLSALATLEVHRCL